MRLDIVEHLHHQLNKPLPGSRAHRKVRPRVAGDLNLRKKKDQKAVPSAVLILLYRFEDRWYIPLIQRPTYDGAHSGQVALPGGKWESTDADLVQTALRETMEEIGVNADHVSVIGTITPLYVEVSNYEILPVIGLMDYKPDFVPDHQEVVEVLETELDILSNPDTLKETELTVRNNIRIHAPFYDVHGKVVWGATAAILTEFIDIIRQE